MVQQLSAECFEPIHAQMEHKEGDKVTLKDIPDLTDVPNYRSTITIFKHFRDFETYLSQCYGVEGFPLDYDVKTRLASAHWGDSEAPRPRPGGKEPIPDFSNFKESNYQCHRFTHIIDPKYEGMVRLHNRLSWLSTRPGSMQIAA